MKNRIISRLGQKTIFLCSHSLQLSLLPHLFLTQTKSIKKENDLYSWSMAKTILVILFA